MLSSHPQDRLSSRRRIAASRAFGLRSLIGLFAAIAATLFSFALPNPGYAETPCNVQNGLGTFEAADGPSDCWRPYSSTASPFNRRIPAHSASAPDSRAIVQRMTDESPLNYFVAGDEERDYGIPSYFASEGDPTYTVHCTAPWGECDLEGVEIPVPEGAQPSGVWPLEHPGDFQDSHLTIVDQASGTEYDLWDVRSISGGQVVTSWGGKTEIGGDGLGSDAVASRFGSLAGTIRAEEMASGTIRHALVLNVPCTNGYVWPATKGALECSEAGMPTEGAPAVGQRLQLRMGARSIRHRYPKWKESILLAFHRYGAYVSDTTGTADQWSLRFASSATYSSYDSPDRFVALAQKAGLTPEDYNANGQDEYWFDVGGHVNWTKRLRVVNPPAH